MKITEDEVLHVAHLARLDVDAGAVEKLADQIGEILAYVETLDAVDTENVPPTTHAISLTNAFREDRPVPSLETDLALSNAPEWENGTFVVPKIIE